MRYDAKKTNEELMHFALQAAIWSPDPSTQNGALLARDGVPIMATAACNEFPRDVKYTDERWERPLKYSFIEHAERNAIFLAARFGISTQGMTLIAPWAACAECARAIIQAGIKEVVALRVPDDAAGHRWEASIALATTMLHEADVAFTYVTPSEPFGIKLRRGGEEWAC